MWCKADLKGPSLAGKQAQKKLQLKENLFRFPVIDLKVFNLNSEFQCCNMSKGLHIDIYKSKKVNICKVIIPNILSLSQWLYLCQDDHQAGNDVTYK